MLLISNELKNNINNCKLQIAIRNYKNIGQNFWKKFFFPLGNKSLKVESFKEKIFIKISKSFCFNSIALLHFWILLFKDACKVLKFWKKKKALNLNVFCFVWILSLQYFFYLKNVISKKTLIDIVLKNPKK